MAFSLALTLFLLAGEGHAQSNYEIPRISAAPTIDGEVQSSEWQQAVSIAVTIETEPGENIAAPVATEGLVMEDGEMLYVAFIAQDPDPNQIRAFYRDRDLLWNDDWVAVILDTFNDERRAFEFYVNPLGVQADDIWPALSQIASQARSVRWFTSSQISSACTPRGLT